VERLGVQPKETAVTGINFLRPKNSEKDGFVSSMTLITSLLFPLLGYLFGSLPFSIWVTHFVKGVDVRDSGSGHATTTNTIRQAGFGWGALVLVLDIAKGFIPVWLAVLAGLRTIPRRDGAGLRRWGISGC
jgi:glycerol-3-phosphate acyltransferase PlsY